MNLMKFTSRIKRNNFFIEGISIILFFLISFFFFSTANASTAISENGNNSVLSTEQYTYLNLKDATEMALKNNLTTLLANAKTEEAKGRVFQSVSYLLPHVLLNLQEWRVYKMNLAEMGFSSWGVIGPYNYFDARIQLVQQIFDLSAIERFRAEQINTKIAQLDEELAAKQVRSAVSLAYLDALSAEEELEAAKADLDLARELLKLGRHQNLAGLATSIDVARFETREAEEEARCLHATMNLRKSYIELNRVIGLPLNTDLKLTDSMEFVLERILSVAEEINFADQNRTELKIASERIQHHEFKLKEAKSERLPTLGFMGDYGLAGITPSNSRNVGEVSAVLKMPIFDGGMIKGEIQEAESNKRQSQLIFNDLDKQVQEDVCLALQSLSISAEQVEVAEKVLALANRELKMSRDLFSAGIGDNIQVINAQTALARARQQYVAMLFQYNTARVNLYSALGNIETFSLAKKKGK
jgi:outer membrane protein TolC